MKPILADTSVWIDFFIGAKSSEVDVLTEYLENDYVIFICPIIIQEILQGISSDNTYEEVKDYLLAMPILNDDAIEMAIMAADLYRKMCKKGVTIRKSNDCLIAQYAIKHELKILHKDRDFDLIMKGI